MQPFGKILLLAALPAALGSVACAARRSDDGAVPVAAPKVSLVQAAIAAEKHVSGNAVRVRYESSTQGACYEVEIISGAKVFDVKVDADKGSVLSSTEDKADRDDDDGEEYDDGDGDHGPDAPPASGNAR